MVANITTILKVATSSAQTPETLRAKEILTTANRGITEVLMTCDLGSTCDRVFVTEPSKIAQSRFLEICFKLICLEPESAITRCNFMEKLYKQVHIPAVHIFLESVLLGGERLGVVPDEPCTRGKLIRDLLADGSFYQDIFAFDRNDPQATENAFRLIAVAANKEGKLAPLFKSREFAEKIMPEKAETKEIITAKMDVISAIMCEATSDVFTSHIGEFVEMLKVDETGRFHVHQITVITIIGKIIEFQAESVTPKLIELEFGETLASLASKFPGFANLHGRIRTLVLASLAYPDLRDHVLQPLLRVYHEDFTARKPYWIYAWKLFRALQKRFASNTGLKGLCSLVINWNEALDEEILDVLQRKRENYGGEVPQLTNWFPGSSLTPQQQLMLLMRLMQMKR